MKKYRDEHPEAQSEEDKRRADAVKKRIKELYDRQKGKIEANPNAFSNFRTHALRHFDEQEMALWNKIGTFDKGEDHQKSAACFIDAILLTAEYLSRDATFTAHHHIGVKSPKGILTDATLRALIETASKNAPLETWKDQEHFITTVCAQSPDTDSDERVRR